MILDQGMADIVEDVYDDLVNGKAGTGTNLFLKNQTGLTNEVVATEVALVDKRFTRRNISVTHLLTVSVGNSSDLTEFEVNNSSISFNRSVKAGVLKNNTIELTTIHTFNFEVFV